MNTSLSLLLAATAIALSSPTAVSQSNPSDSITYACISRDGIPTTIATDTSENEVPIFHWNSDYLPDSEDPEQLCQQVTDNLSDMGGEYYGFATKMMTNGMPAVCVEDMAGDCNRVLFVLPPSHDGIPELALTQINAVLGNILDDRFEPLDDPSRVRGFLSARYPVNPFNILLGR